MDRRLAFLICLSVFLLLTAFFIALRGGFFPVVHDIAVANITVSKDEVYVGDVVSIIVNAKNEGSGTENFNVTCSYNITAIGTQTVTDMVAGADTNLTFSWDTSNVSPASYIIKAEASVVPGETDTADNTYTTGTMPVKTKAMLYVNPQENTGTIGKSFTVNITISNVANLYGYEFELKYDTTILNIFNITEGDFLKQGGDTLFGSKINNTEGYARIFCLLFGDTTGMNGNGTLVTITFEAIGEGSSLIDLYNTKLRDSQPQPIPHFTVDGSVEV